MRLPIRLRLALLARSASPQASSGASFMRVRRPVIARVPARYARPTRRRGRRCGIEHSDCGGGRPGPCRRGAGASAAGSTRSEEHTSELQSLMRISYAVFCLKKKKKDSKDMVVEQYKLI